MINKKLFGIFIIFLGFCFSSLQNSEKSEPTFDYKFLYELGNLKYQDLSLNKPNGLIIFKSNLTICSLYSPKCKVSFLMSNLMSECDIKFKSDNLRVFEIRTARPCEIECPKYEEFFLANHTIDEKIVNNYKVKFFYLNFQKKLKILILSIKNPGL
jgi:hypothetical protein